MNKAIILLLLLLSIAVNAYADVLYLKNGTQYTGTVIKQDDQKVIFKIGEAQDSFEATFFAEEVLRIDKPGLSNFITLPSGEGPSIEIPRPIIPQEPVVAEQVRIQKTKTVQESADIAEEIDMQIEDSGQLENAESIDKPVEIKVEDSSATSEIQPQDISQEATPPTPSFEGHVITEELSKLLDEEEKAYFLNINEVVKDITAKMAVLIADPDALAAKDQNELKAVVQHMPEEVDNIISKFKNIKAPALFVDFHAKYLDNLALMKDIFSAIAQGSVEDAQNKIAELQKVATQMQDELSKILDIKLKGGVI
jgi:hypothetical protein